MKKKLNKNETAAGQTKHISLWPNSRLQMASMKPVLWDGGPDSRFDSHTSPITVKRGHYQGCWDGGYEGDPASTCSSAANRLWDFSQAVC